MTNAEKFKEVFGFEMRQSICPFEGVDVQSRCGECKWIIYADCCKKFWQSDYQGTPTIPLSVIEDIKAEIKAKSQPKYDTALKLYYSEKVDVLEIINRKVNEVTKNVSEL